MNDRPATATVIDTCEIVWWSGYVTGRFQAYRGLSWGAPELLAQSPAIRCRSSSPPPQTEEIAEAHDKLVRQLQEDGWERSGQSEEFWFGVLLSREAREGDPLPPDGEPERPAQQSEALRQEPDLVARLQAQLGEAHSETERERKRRLAAERVAASVPPAVETPALHLIDSRSATRRARSRWLFVAYAIGVLIAAAVFLVGFKSLYAAGVAALTVAAVAVALDSWLVVHRVVERLPSPHTDR